VLVAVAALPAKILDALADALEDGTATFKDPYRVSSERFRRAVDALLECIEAL
jgi:hypothetical protein